MNVIVTGGAGYIGSIVATRLLAAGHQPVIVDDLRQGHRQAVPPGCEFHQFDFGDEAAMGELMSSRRYDAVVHLAAETVVEFSMTDPGRYFRNNVASGIRLLDLMVRHHIPGIIFSSSAATYGEPQTTPIEEDHPTAPVNSYGESKIMFERTLRWYGTAYGLRHISFRYFNACGALGPQGEDHRPETHLVPNLIKAALTGQTATIFGTDYHTRDGSCVRDYVHVADIARAHVLAVEKVSAIGARAYNIGNGDGFSVLEVVEETRRITGKQLKIVKAGRRPGDPATLVASSQRIRAELGWAPEYPSLTAMIGTACEWHKTHPDGYES